jgi:hypothetical protein
MNVVTFLPPAKATHLGGSRVSRPVRRRHRSKRQTRHDQVIVSMRLAGPDSDPCGSVGGLTPDATPTLPGAVSGYGV